VSRSPVRPERAARTCGPRPWTRVAPAGYTWIMVRTVATFAVFIVVACGAQVERPAAPQPEPARARAALATLHVQNLTAERLTVLYRISGRAAAAEIAVGFVPPESSAVLAPVPAGEPIVLVARTEGGAEITLPARSFAIDGVWTWLIPAEARFIPAGRGD
jgi:hypothetical protein